MITPLLTTLTKTYFFFIHRRTSDIEAMLQWFQRLMPRQDVFFPTFERHAAVIVKAAMALREMVVDGDQLKLHFQEVLALEDEADSIAQEVLLGLRTTFITPFDRDDMQSLITSMDDSVDQCKRAAKSIILFEVKTLRVDTTVAIELAASCRPLSKSKTRATAISTARSMSEPAIAGKPPVALKRAR